MLPPGSSQLNSLASNDPRSSRLLGDLALHPGSTWSPNVAVDVVKLKGSAKFPLANAVSGGLNKVERSEVVALSGTALPTVGARSGREGG